MQAIDYVSLSPGQFTMGATASETGSYPDETPSQNVTLTKGFSIGITVVTQGQWSAVMETRPWEGDALAQDHPDCPAVCVSWSETKQYLARLSQHEGALCRLPTEAEWEYACRAGTTGRWSFGDDEEELGEYGWFFWNAWHKGLYQPRLVATRQPNPWGLHDFHGNVWEWCLDWYGPYDGIPQTDPRGPSTGIYRVVRGGDLMRGSWDLRSAARAVYLPDSRGSLIGFRVVKES